MDARHIEYTAERVFWVPPESRWHSLQNQAARADISTLIDDAILAVERDNANLKGKLPRDYARRGIAPEEMKGLIDLVANIGFKGDRSKARDTLGRVYEYFLSKFAAAEGKLGGEFFTPRSIVRLLVEMLEPYEGRVYDPCCGSAKNTIHVFGDYADVYDIRQAVEDGATRPIYYESRIVKLKVDEEGARIAEEEVESVVNANLSGEPNDEAEEDRFRVPLEALVGAPERLDRLAAFIVQHWEKRRAAMEGKAMIVTMSRDIAARLYEAICVLRPGWHDADDERGAMKVVVTGTDDDPEPLRSHARSKVARKRLAERFKAPDDDLRLVIVCDMWLTGFDCPPAHTMYLEKPLAGHNLMQAIARVNRVYGDKPGGLIVDLLGLADQLADALAIYTQAGGKGEAVQAVQAVQDEAVPAMLAAFEKLRSFFHGCAYESALDTTPQAVLAVYLRVVDHVFGQDNGWKRLRTLVIELSAAFALAVPRRETEAVTPHLAFFQRVVAMIAKRLADDDGAGAGRARQRDIDAAVRQVIGGAVDADEVIDLFAVAGLEEARLDILSDEFLGRVAALEQKNSSPWSLGLQKFANSKSLCPAEDILSARESENVCAANGTSSSWRRRGESVWQVEPAEG